MPLTKLTTSPEKVIQGLADNPKMSSSELKAKFDEGAGLIKTYINNTLIKEIEDSLATVLLGQIVNGSITIEKLSPSIQANIQKKSVGDTLYTYNHLGGF